MCIKVIDTKQMHLSGPFIFKWLELENYYPFLPFDYVTSEKVDMLETIPQNLGSMVMNWRRDPSMDNLEKGGVLEGKGDVS